MRCLALLRGGGWLSPPLTPHQCCSVAEPVQSQSVQTPAQLTAHCSLTVQHFLPFYFSEITRTQHTLLPPPNLISILGKKVTDQPALYRNIYPIWGEVTQCEVSVKGHECN